MKIKSISYVISIVLTLITLSGCVRGTAVRAAMDYNKEAKNVEQTNKAMLLLDVGMTKSQVMDAVGEPSKNEGYKNISIWYYRTSVSEGSTYGSRDYEFTPVVFNADGKVEGWGRQFLESSVQRYQINVD